MQNIPLGLNSSIVQERGINIQNQPLTSKLLNNKPNVNQPAYITPQNNVNSQKPIQYEFPDSLEETISPVKFTPFNIKVLHKSRNQPSIAQNTPTEPQPQALKLLHHRRLFKQRH